MSRDSPEHSASPMRRLSVIFPIIAVLASLAGCGQKKAPSAYTPPVANRIPTRLTLHGQTRVDNYYWLRDDTRRNAAVLKLIKAENQYTREVMSRDSKLQDELFNEISGRLQDSDNTVPVRDGHYLYYREIRAGHQYPVYVRRPDQPGAASEVVLDVN
ncbi:MAG TPA: hypothetical protein VJ998_01300, partial [Pseudomonadales bacterium]|nr:hypothetical protein [Pseudomonadales bacterium]